VTPELGVGSHPSRVGPSGRFGQSRKCTRASLARTALPHRQPQGIAGPAGRPAPGAFFRFGPARLSAIECSPVCVQPPFCESKTVSVRLTVIVSLIPESVHVRDAWLPNALVRNGAGGDCWQEATGHGGQSGMQGRPG